MGKIPCSALDRVMACNGSLVPTDTPHNPQSEYATDGRAKHEALSYIPRGEFESIPYEEIGAKHGVDSDDLERAAKIGLEAWGEVSEWFPDAEAEFPVESELLIGRVDVASMPHGLDWKTGFTMTEHPYQLLGYSSCMRAMSESTVKRLGIEIWLRHRRLRIERISDDALDSFETRLRRQIDRTGKDYAPGEHCLFCPRTNECQARIDYVHAATGALAPFDNDSALTRDRLAQLYPQAKVLEKALKHFNRLLREELMHGALTLEDGKRIGLIERTEKKLEIRQAWPVLSDLLSQDELAECVSVSKTKVMDKIKQHAPPRKGAAHQRAAMARFYEAKAVREITKSIVGVIPKPKEK
jgi:hypothetical protein